MEIQTKKSINLKLILVKILGVGFGHRLRNNRQERSTKLISGIQRLRPCERTQPLRGYTTVLDTQRRIRHSS